ncbi:MAG: hypothetical protein V2A71_09240 [Candidatus Eisenbacteria bacterium]
MSRAVHVTNRGAAVSPLALVTPILVTLGLTVALLATNTEDLRASSVVVTTSQSEDASALTCQRKLFRDSDGYFWDFYFDGTNTYLERSNDTTGTSWSMPAQLFYTGETQPTTWVNGDTVYVAFYAGGNILVRRGVTGGGSIAWSATQTALIGGGGTSYSRASICRDTGGFIWVAARLQTAGGYRLCAARSLLPGEIGAWQPPAFVSALTASDLLYVAIVPLPGGDIYAIWNRQGWIEGKRYVSGTGWQASTTSIANGFSGSEQMLFSAVGDRDGMIHLLYSSRFLPVCYRRYDGTSWSSEQVLSGGSASSPAISINPSNNRLYALWIEDRVVEGKSALLPSSSADWRVESVGTGKARKGSLTSCYGSASRICWNYTQGGGVPYTVMFDGLAVGKLSVLVSKSSFAFGSQPLNTWLTPESTQITNDGTCTENIYAKLSRFVCGAASWGISPVANGPDVCRAQWSSVSAAGPWTNIAAYNTEFLLAAGVPPNGSIIFYFRLQTPTLSSVEGEYSATLTVRATD